MEIAFGIRALVILAGLAWGGISYVIRNKRLDPMSERTTRKIMDNPGPEPMKDDRRQQRGGVPRSS
jgi:hypothetical protein